MSRFTKVNVSGDGACYFHAVSGYLEMESLVKKGTTYYKKGNASALRKLVVSWLRNNLDYKMPTGMTIRNEIEDEITQNSRYSSIKDYLTHMSKESTYAGQIEITATAVLLKRNIRVYIMRKGTYSNVGLGYEITKSKEDDIHLFHNLGSGVGKGLHHFEILFPTSKGEVVTKHQYTKLKSKDKYKMPKKSVVKRRRSKQALRKRTVRKRTLKKRTKKMKRKQPKKSKKEKRRSKRTRRRFIGGRKCRCGMGHAVACGVGGEDAKEVIKQGLPTNSCCSQGGLCHEPHSHRHTWQ